jgi:myo-inositol-1(or 4)-monophosphatase
MVNKLSSQPSISNLVDWARIAGEILRQGFDKEHHIEHKGEVDLVTEMDRLSEKYLITRIREKFPDHAIVTEESGLVHGDNDHCWYIDPLDGTLNYTHKFPLFSVSLAYAENGHVTHGVIFDPMRDECFSAVRGKGAWLNETPIHVSQTAALNQSLLCTGFSSDDNSKGKLNIGFFADFQNMSQGVRRLGSAALDLCYVAAGRLDGFWEMELHAWDVAAGALVVEEADGVVTNLNGDAHYFLPPYDLVAANPTIHALMIEVTRKKAV